jgi:glutamyl-tRNA reductase
LDFRLIVIGANHRSAPIAIRERFWLSEGRRFQAMRKLVATAAVEEAVILATCNRTEFILWAGDLTAARSAVCELLGISQADFASHFYVQESDAAIAHVFRVAAGLDSMVLGEPEITGQVKNAWQAAQAAGLTGRFLDAVFQKGLNVSKRVRSDTAIGNAAVSVPYAAVELAKQIFGSLKNRQVLVLGAGKMGELSARYLRNNGVQAIHVVNRTRHNAEKLASELDGVAVDYEDRWKCYAEDDIVISSTGCPHLILLREDAERIREVRRGRPIFVIDIAVPRDVDPAVRNVPGFYLYDIDDLQAVVARNLNDRQAAAADAERIIARETQRFSAQLDAQRVVPTLVALRERLEEIRQQEMARYRADAGEAPSETAVERLTERIVQRIADRMAAELKQAPERAKQDYLAKALGELFKLGSLRPASDSKAQ